MPGLVGLSGGAEVIVESVVLDSSPLAVDVPISCLLRVTSFQASPRLRVEARRFWIEAGRTRIQARPTSSKTPALPAAYLKAGESVSGWLTFEVPRDAKDVILKADLQKPPMDVPLTLPAGWDR
jgi:hypothetical protein